MQNAKCRMQKKAKNTPIFAFCILPFAFFYVFGFVKSTFGTVFASGGAWNKG
jgi:hypothetical protein